MADFGHPMADFGHPMADFGHPNIHIFVCNGMKKNWTPNSPPNVYFWTPNSEILAKALSPDVCADRWRKQIAICAFWPPKHTYTWSMSLRILKSSLIKLKNFSIEFSSSHFQLWLFHRMPFQISCSDIIICNSCKPQRIFFSIWSSAVVFRLFPKPVNLPQKTVGYRLTLIQSSNLYFSLIF